MWDTLLLLRDMAGVRTGGLGFWHLALWREGGIHSSKVFWRFTRRPDYMLRGLVLMSP